MTTRKVKITLLGTGSSGGVPRVGGDWGACDPTEPKNQRRRCSALVETWDTRLPEEKTIVLVDTSPDLREQLLDANVKRLDAILFTHDQHPEMGVAWVAPGGIEAVTQTGDCVLSLEHILPVPGRIHPAIKGLIDGPVSDADIFT